MPKLYFFGNSTIMDSQLIIHSTNQRIYSCCFCWDALVCLAGETSLQLWDSLTGTIVSKFEYGQLLAPISINLISQQKQTSLYFLQDKSGLILLIEHKAETGTFNLLTSYQIQPIGFTKLCPWMFVYNQEGHPHKQKSKTFFTIFQNEQIQQRNILSGQVIKKFAAEDIKFVDVTAMMQYEIQSKRFFLVAEEGNSIKKVVIYGSTELQCQNVQNVTLASDKQIKIVLEFQPIQMYLVVAVLRQDRLVILDLKKMQIFANIQAFKMIRSIKVLKDPNLWAFSQKKAIGVIQKSKKVIKKQKIFTQLVIGIDVCDWGIVGASEQGKLFALPL